MIALIGSLLMWSYFISLTLFGDPRIIDNSLPPERTYWWEHIIMCQGLVLTFSLLFSALYHSFTIAGRKKWVVAILLFFPLAYVYAWLYYPKE